VRVWPEPPHSALRYTCQHSWVRLCTAWPDRKRPRSTRIQSAHPTLPTAFFWLVFAQASREKESAIVKFVANVFEHTCTCGCQNWHCVASPSISLGSRPFSLKSKATINYQHGRYVINWQLINTDVTVRSDHCPRPSAQQVSANQSEGDPHTHTHVMTSPCEPCQVTTPFI
jgi:hypothetical protein